MRVKANRLILMLCVFLIGSTAQAKYGGGSGTADDPYLIYTAEQMNTIGAEPNDWDKHFKLAVDIDLKDFGGSSFNLIGSDSQPFKGIFNGNNHTISNLTYIITGNEDEVDPNFIRSFGLFRYIDDPNAIINNLILVNPDLRPASTCQKRVIYMGALAGSLNSGLISNCYLESGHVLGESGVGGLVGWNRGTISDCNTTCTVGLAEERPLASVNELLDRREFFGGLAGFNSGEISNCHTTGKVTGERKVGGLVGEAYGMITNSWSGSDVSGDVFVGGLIGMSRRSSILSHCYTTGNVSGQKIVGGLVGECSKGSSINNCYVTGSISAEEQAGGLVGWHEGSDISECYSTAFVVADSNQVGGLVGINGSTIRTSCAHGYVSGKKRVGGLVGWNWKEDMLLNYNPVVTDCYATGRVHGEDFVGGLIGANQGGYISSCYSTGKVKGTLEDSIAGGLAGADSGTVENCFWDTVTSGLDTSESGTGKTTTEMQDMWIYFNAGWDFEGEKANGTDDVWKMCCGRSIYPKLAWEQVLIGDFVEPEGVDVLDLAFLAEHWIQTVGLPCNNPDLTVDAHIDIKDFALMAQYWRCGSREIIFETALDETPCFVTQGQWQFGIPAGLGGVEYGYPDPGACYTGDNVYGVNLQGDYSIAVNEPHFLTAGPFDCSLYRDVKLQFARWLNSDEADYVSATIEFSTDGIRWVPVWEYEDTEVGHTDNIWHVVIYNLGVMADHRESLYIRWGYEIKDVEAWPMSGWNIDDIIISAVRW